MKTYGIHTCKRCGKAPIMTFPIREAEEWEMRQYYLPKKGKRSEPEIWNIFYPTSDHPGRLCEYCDLVTRGFFNIVPIVDIVKKIGRGTSLSPEEQSRYRKHLQVQAGDSVWDW